MPDKTQYEFNGKTLGKGPLALAVIKYLVEEQEHSFEELNKLLDGFKFRSGGVLLDAQEYLNRLTVKPDTKNRFFKDDSITDKKGQEFLVSSQWGLGNIDKLVVWGRNFGLEIKILVDESSILFKKFSAYKQGPMPPWITTWINSYNDLCTYIKSIDPDAFDYSEQSFLERYWRDASNGISSVKPGFLSNDEFSALKSEFPDISKKILQDPSSETLDNVIAWAKQAKQSGKFNTIKYGVIHRFFCACAPQQYCSILNLDHLKAFIHKWNEQKLGPKIEPKGNWADLNQSIVQTIKLRGFEDEDLYLLNTFIYRLKEDILGEIDDVFGIGSVNADGYNSTQNRSLEGLETISLNTILYGPPGTGKTYHTVDMAVRTADPDFSGNREQIKKRYDELVLEKRIRFVTFHQSFSYEEFIEGLKASTDSGSISYQVEPGIFKKLCNDAAVGSTKVTNSLNLAIESFKSTLDEKETFALKTLKGKPFNIEYHGNSTFRIFPSNSKHDDLGRGYPVSIEHIHELYRNPETDIVYNRSYAKSILLYLKSKYDVKDFVHPTTHTQENYVLIIDEINRGNISKIFGELITLIEPSKRAGQPESLTIRLPYSNEPFSVPNNLHIIGTMNTADRSLAMMDTALRRRFDFVEMMPDYGVLNGTEVCGVDLAELLKSMNDRIEYLYDREHMLGHAFFIPVKEAALEHKQEELISVFKNKVIPLLEEYFYEDWAKIRLVLGDNQKNDTDHQFVTEVTDARGAKALFGNAYEDNQYEGETKRYQLNEDAFAEPESYLGILGKSN
ncbi:McrB family protein [Alkalimarinus alittae]|uniref:AAA family ATPase n=1 Tax=Alkalimarinus alittae TaxID=2961619 RepID=A0ABY6MX84_9ALTE|nr:AAA family ATPase [Alkalimarinus alittae]UZE94439.1 AAA family ATPase [Alkalimarinus alittae]